MTRPGVPLFLCLLVIQAGSEGAQESVELPEQSIQVDVNLVTLRFTVRDAQGKPANHLTLSDFRVSESGTLQEIAFFEAPRNRSGRLRRLRLAFLLDISGSTFATRAEEIAAAQTFLENVHDFTEVGVFGFTDRLIAFQDFTSRRELAAAAFNAGRQHIGKTAIYDSLQNLISRISPRGGAAVQNAIIVISDGMDEAYQKAAQTISLARRSQTEIYTILVPSAVQLYIGPDGGIQPAEQEPRKNAFARLSLETGGKHFSGFETILNFDEVMAQINDALFGNLYSLGYYTSDPSLSKRERNIRIEVTQPGVLVSVPFENLPERLTTKKRFIAALFDNQAIGQLPDELHRTFRDLGAEMDVLPARREGGEVGLPFRIKISPYGLRGSPGEGVRTQMGVIGLLLDQEGREVVRLREIFRVNLSAKEIREGRGIIYTNKLLAPPGVYSFKLALLEIPSWKMAAFQRPVRVIER